MRDRLNIKTSYKCSVYYKGPHCVFYNIGVASVYALLVNY